MERGAHYELWYADGAKFELLPVVTHAWRQRGKPQYIPTPGQNVRLAVCGAFRWPGGPFFFSHGPHYVNTNLFICLLSKLEARARQTGRLVIVVLDNASVHRSRRSRQALESLQGRVQPFWLPKYSSEQLNEIEAVWKHLKEDYFSRMLSRDRETFATQAVRFLERLSQRATFRSVYRSDAVASMSKDLVVIA